jgi:hypothetical protein
MDKLNDNLKNKIMDMYLDKNEKINKKELLREMLMKRKYGFTLFKYRGILLQYNWGTATIFN